MKTVPISKARPNLEVLVGQVRKDPTKEFAITFRGRRIAYLINANRWKAHRRKSGIPRP